jgi:hypothetical protein
MAALSALDGGVQRVRISDIAAIADATGVWIADLPASPERILAALTGVRAIAPLAPAVSEPAR